VVPEPPGQDEAGLRGAEEGPGDVGGAQRAQDIPGDGPEHGHTEEETATGGRVRFARRPGQVRRVNRFYGTVAARNVRSRVRHSPPTAPLGRHRYDV